jgi:sucrose phosphorylase
MHLPETHEVVRLWRTVLDLVAPGTMVVTETNVPHQENLSYFGSGEDEAHLVYQFALPPLMLAAFHQRGARRLGAWADTLLAPSERTSFLNFLASHDGIGLRAAETLLSHDEVDALCAAVAATGGLVSARALPGGGTAPYEINATYLDALRRPGVEEPQHVLVDRFLAAHAIMLALTGVPLLYFHSMFGSRNWAEGVARTGQARTINRERLSAARLESELADPGSLRRQVIDGLKRMLRTRASEPAFHPNARQRWLPADLPGHLALERVPLAGGRPVVAVTDVSGQAGRFRARATVLPPAPRLVDLLDGSQHAVEPDGTIDVPLPAYGVRWLRVS